MAMNAAPPATTESSAEARSTNRDRSSGFTLLELLVAIALAAIISFCISFVSTQAQNVYVATTEKVEVYQKFRYALADMQENLSNMVLTADLEFFVDSQQSDLRGHWEEGEEYKERVNLEGGRPAPGRYDEGALIIQRSYTVEDDDTERERDNFSVYFKAVTEIGDEVRVANIEYYLADPESLTKGELGRVEKTVPRNTKPGLPEAHKGFVLVKVVRWVDVPDIMSPTDRTVRKKVIELCQNVTDLKIEYFADNLFDAKPGQFVTPDMERSDVIKSETGIEKLSDGGLVKEFLYGGWQNIRKGTATKGVRDIRTGNQVPVYFSLGAATSGINFSELRYRDTIYIWNEGSSGDLLNGEYTVKRNEAGRLYFVENIDSSTWNGDSGGLRFRAGYLPSALRVTIRVLNDTGQEPRILSTVVRPIRKNN